MHYIYIIGVVLSWIIIALTLIHVVMDNRQPAKTMAWALIILFVPLIGIIFYFFFGVNHRRERLVSQRSLDQLSKRSMLNFVEQHDLKVPEAHKQMVDLFVNQSLSLPFKDNLIDIMTDGYAFFPCLLNDIAQAKHHIHIDMYIFEDDALGYLISDALIAKAREGVEVRVIYDDVGCWKVSHSFFERMRMAGIDDPQAANEVIRRIKENHNGLINCKDLLRANAENGGEKMPHCNAMIRECIGYVEEILREKGKLGDR